jgi:hypothetical protein
MKIFAWLFLIAVSHTCFADDYQKNGLPCLAELCIGDGIAELKKIQWESVDLTGFSRAKNDTTAYFDGIIAAHYKGDISKQTTLFLKSTSFDGMALPLLARISAACEGAEGLSGVYKSKSGAKTKVFIRMSQSTRDSAEQQWVVSMIQQSFFNSDGTRYATQDIKNAEMQLVERYKKFNMNDERGMPKTKWLYKKNPPPENASFSFRSSLDWFEFVLRDERPSNQTQPHPLCLKKINID